MTQQYRTQKLIAGKTTVNTTATNQSHVYVYVLVVHKWYTNIHTHTRTHLILTLIHLHRDEVFLEKFAVLSRTLTSVVEKIHIFLLCSLYDCTMFVQFRMVAAKTQVMKY